MGVNWQNCWLKQKLSTVLWVPIICDTPSEKKYSFSKSAELAVRFFGHLLKKRRATFGNGLAGINRHDCARRSRKKIDGKHGQVLQLRPKAANAKAKTQAFDKHGKPFMTLPRGFYLKIPFTQAILNKNLRINSL